MACRIRQRVFESKQPNHISKMITPATDRIRAISFDETLLEFRNFTPSDLSSGTFAVIAEIAETSQAIFNFLALAMKAEHGMAGSTLVTNIIVFCRLCNKDDIIKHHLATLPESWIASTAEFLTREPELLTQRVTERRAEYACLDALLTVAEGIAAEEGGEREEVLKITHLSYFVILSIFLSSQFSEKWDHIQKYGAET